MYWRPARKYIFIYYQLSAYTDFTESDDETEDYLDKGYSFVVKCMARNFENDRVKLKSTVSKIQTADDCVCATVQDGEVYCGSYGIVTFSSGALQAAVRGDDNSVEFDPPLPQLKQDANQQCHTHSLRKGLSDIQHYILVLMRFSRHV